MTPAVDGVWMDNDTRLPPTPCELGMMEFRPSIPHSPWGAPDHITVYAPGIVFVGTPSHGGFRLLPTQLEQVPLAWRKARFGLSTSPTSPWFEEDCDWCMVALTFPYLFHEEAVRIARMTFDAWIRPKLEKVA